MWKFNSLLIILLFSCGGEKIKTPKPPTYLRLDLPAHMYSTYQSECPYTFEISEAYRVTKPSNDTNSCHRDINLGPLNGTIHFSYIEMTEPLSVYVNFANDKVEEHKIKATGITDQQIIRPEDNVYGTYFSLKGDVASPFQFYLTDSTSRFVSGVLYFNSVPNYDSMRPVLDYVDLDIKQLLNTFKWKN